MTPLPISHLHQLSFVFRALLHATDLSLLSNCHLKNNLEEEKVCHFLTFKERGIVRDEGQVTLREDLLTRGNVVKPVLC